jgi:uncharacterized protein YbjT (DUF2867 family)
MKPWILLTGATGYIGGRLLKLLEAEGHPVCCFTLRPEFLQGRVAARSEVVTGNVLDADSLRRATNGVQLLFAGMLCGIARVAEHPSGKT